MLSHKLTLINNEIVVFKKENLTLWQEQYNILSVDDPDERDPNAALTREARKEILLKNCRQGLDFLNKLKNTPGIVLTDLKIKACKELESFNMLHPTNQNIFIRKTYMQLYDRATPNREPTSNESLRKEYYDLCYLLWIILQEMENNKNNSNKQFEQVIINIIKESHIPIFGDLPDELNTIPKFFRLDTVWAAREKIMDDAALQAKECSQFEVEYNKLQAKITEMENGSELIQTNLIKDLIKEIDTQKAAPNFDIKFTTVVIKQTNRLLENPYNENIQRNYYDLAEHAEGRPTQFKTLTGLMLRLLGCITITAAFGLVILALAPPMWVTIPIYATLLLAGGLFKIGSSIVFHSDTYLQNGVRHGMSLNMEQTVGEFRRAGVGMRV